MSSGWIDAHCHLSDDRILPHLDSMLAESEAQGIRRWVLAGVSPEDWDAQESLHHRLGTKVIPCFGLHPWWVAEHSQSEVATALSRLETMLTKATLLGETGLDYFGPRGAAEKAERQEHAFYAQLEMAVAFKMPLVLHIVRAHENALKILQSAAPVGGWQGWVHSYSGSAEQVRQYLELGFCISLGGSTTRMQEVKLKKLLDAVPSDRLLIETDAPDQAPHFAQLNEMGAVISPVTGADTPAINRPVNLLAIATFLSEFCGKTPSQLLDRSRENIETVLGKKT